MVIDAILLTAGLLVLLGVAVCWLRDGQWRNPLARTPHPSGTVTIVEVAFVILAWGLLASLLVPIFQNALTEQNAGRERPTPVIHAVLAGDGIAKLVGAALGLWCLWRVAPGAPAARRVSLPIGLCWVIGGVLVARLLTTTQLNMQMAAWQLLVPDAAVPPHPILDAMSDPASPLWERIHLWIHAVGVAPIVEEVFFRGVLLSALVGMIGRGWPAILIAAVPFGLVHLSVAVAVLPMVTLAVLLGFIQLRTGSLSVCIAIHVLFNGWTMVAAALMRSAGD